MVLLMLKRFISRLGFAITLWVLLAWSAPVRRPARGMFGAGDANQDRIGPPNPTTVRPRPESNAAPAPRRAYRPEGDDLAPVPLEAVPGVAMDQVVRVEDLFTATNVPRIHLEIPPSGIKELRRMRNWNDADRPTVKATVREGGRVYTNVAVHLKGATGSFTTIDQNPCLTLNFTKFAPGQLFHGLHKLSLNNSKEDRSFLCEKISRELFEAAGVPVPRAGYAVVALNDKYLGMHVLTEGWSRRFLDRYFSDTQGNLYDGGYMQDIDAPMTVVCGKNPGDHSGLRALILAAVDADPSRRWARLNRVLDMDRFVSFVAMSVLQCNWDGYAMGRNNWRLFQDLSTHKMVFMPHGLDQTFGPRVTTPAGSIKAPMQGRVARAVLETAEGQRAYLERLSQLYSEVFHVDAVLKRVDELAAIIRPAIAQGRPRAAERHDQAVRRLKERIIFRDQSLKQQLRDLGLLPDTQDKRP